jgi:hypothetical protein
MAIHISVIGVVTALFCYFAQLQLALADPSYACKDNFPTPVEWDAKPGEIRMFRVNDRTIRVTLPAGYKKGVPAPLILAYHDTDMAPERMEYETALYDVKVNPDAVVVYPLAANVMLPFSFLSWLRG